MNNKVKQQSKKAGKQQNSSIKRERSKSVERAKSGKKLKDEKSDRGQKKSLVVNKEMKSRQGSVKKLQRSSSVQALKKVQSDKNLRPKSDHKRPNNAKVDPKANKQNAQKPLASPNNPVKNAKSRAVEPTNRSNREEPVKKQPKKESVEPLDMGLTFIRPQFDKLICDALQNTDDVFDKYYDMINNDNDTYYVLNAIPEIKDYQKEIDEKKRNAQPVLTGKMSKISGLFQQFSVDKITNAIRVKPIYFQNKVKVTNLKLILFTKFKVSVDIGFLQYTTEGDKLVVLRLYLSKIYRKMNYLAYVMTEALKILTEKHPTVERCCIFLHQKNLNIVKWFKYLGFKIERILTDSKSQKVDYFQEFVCKKKQFLAAYQKAV